MRPRIGIPVLSLVLTLAFFGKMACIGQTVDSTVVDGNVSPTFSLMAWHNFRAAHPFHIQVVALSQPWGNNGGRTLIVSEPPPNVQLSDVTKLSPCIASADTRQMQVGFDGWVRDIVLTLGPCSDEQVQSLVVALHRLMFRTAYKAYSVPIGVEQSSSAKTELNLHVTSAQLNHWLIGTTRERPSARSWPILIMWLLFAAVYLWITKSLLGKRRFIPLVLISGLFCIFLLVGFPHGARRSDSEVLRLKPVLGGESITLQTLLDQGAHGVYGTIQPGLVVWCVGKEKNLDKSAIEIREFAVDSDLLLGSISLGGDVAIVGRGRSTSIALLPPLRAETVLQLAAAHTTELAQSYERKFLFAGKTNLNVNGSQQPDWAPIYLSDQLVDTEYGSLLNITDQMLKSWSMHGLVRYVNFPYPDPATFPFSRALPEEAKTNEVTFNWNTRGAGYVSRFGDVEVYSLSRLGSLPIDYLAQDNDNLRRAEDTAYRYYSELSDPNLVRVVQYAGLYQIFTRFGITATEATPPHHAINALKERADQIVQNFAEEPDSDATFGGSDFMATRLRAAHTLLKKFVSAASPEQYDSLITCLADPAAERIDNESDDRATRGIGEVCGEVSSAVQIFLPENLRTAAGVLYERAADNRTGSGWIHTPSVVYSLATGWATGGTGGHNLSAAVTDFQVDNALAAGEVRVGTEDGKLVVYHSAADSDKIPDTARLAGRDADKEADALKQELETLLQQQADDKRTLRETLHLGDQPPSTGTLGFQVAQIPPEGHASGWWNANDAPPPEIGRLVDAFAARKNQRIRPALIVARGTDYRYDISGPAGMHIHADNLPAAVEAVRAATQDTFAAEGVHLHFVGIDETEGNGFVRSTEAHMPGEGDVDATFEGSMTPEEIHALAADYDFSKVTVREVSSPHVVDGHAVVDADLEIASKSWFGKPLLVRIRLFFSDMASALSFIPEHLNLALRTVSEQVDIFMALSRLKRDLQIAHPGLKQISMEVVDSQRKDLYVAENIGPAGPRQHAGQTA